MKMAEKYVKLSDVKKKMNYICRTYLSSPQIKQRISDALAKIPYTVKEELEATLKVENAPAADVRPERHGRWEAAGNIVVECSACGDVYSATMIPRYYCPNCGAEMDEGH